MKKYIIPIIIALAVIASFASYHKGYTKGQNKAVETIITVRDTLTLTDTIHTVEPKYIAVKTVDTIRVPVPVQGKTDTVWAELPREQKIYRDSTYLAYVSGYAPRLDSIDVYRKTNYIHEVTYIPQEDTRKQFVELDARLVWDNVPSAPLMLNYGRKMGLFEAYAGGGYDVLQHSPVMQVGGRMKFKF